MANFEPVPAFNDNYIWLINDPPSPAAVVVDPGEATLVLQILEKVSPAVIGCILAGVLVVAIRPKAIVFVGPVLVAIALLHCVGWLFKPPPPRQPPRQRGSERAGGGK
jgi:hydroxyacylglutathione hydrolase